MLKRILFQLHMWTGLLAGALIAVMGLSGSALVFRPELERHTRAPLVDVVPGAERQPVERVVEAALREYPGAKLSLLYPPAAEADAYLVVLRSQEKLWRVYVHPYTAAILRAGGKDWIDWLVDLHHNLLSGKNGRTATGIIGMLLLLMCLTGLWLWWPGLNAVRQRMTIRRGVRWKRLNWDLHHAVGFWSAAFLIVLAGTGLYFSFPKPIVFLVQSVTQSVRPNKPPTLPSPVNGPIRLDAVLQAAQATIPEGQISFVRFPAKDTEAVAVRIKLPADPRRAGSSNVYLDRSGEVLRINKFSDLPFGSRVLETIAPFHFGEVGGPIVRILWTVIGVTPGLLFLSGCLMWWNRRARSAAGGRTTQKQMPQEGFVRSQP